jgi:hypothetical protein
MTWMPALAAVSENSVALHAAIAGQRATVHYSIIGTCLRRGLNPCSYLEWLIERLPTATNQSVRQLTPSAYAESAKQEYQLSAYCPGEPEGALLDPEKGRHPAIV